MRVETTVGSCTLRKRGRYWYARGQRELKRFEINLGTPDATEAITRAQEIVPSYVKGTPALLLDGTGIPNDAYYNLMLKNAKSRAKQRGMEFTMTDEDWQQLVKKAGGRCELTGLVFSLAKSKDGYRAPFAPSTDRINCALGYIPGNVRLICVAMNYALSDWGSAVFESIAFAYASKRMGQIAGEMAGLKNTLP
jgi:hypothetical protein